MHRLPLRLVWLALALLAGGCADPPAARSAGASSGAATACATVFVVRRGWHTDIGLPADELGPAARSMQADFPGARYLLFGFGDRHYVLAQDKNFGDLLAALWPGPGLMLVTGLKVAPAEAFGADHVIALAVTPQQAAEVADFVWRSMQHADTGPVTRFAAGPYQGSLYYASSRIYDGWYTCNSWTADALHAGGLPVSSRGALFASQVWKRAGRAAATAGQQAACSGAVGPASLRGRADGFHPDRPPWCRCSAAPLPWCSYPAHPDGCCSG